MRLKNLFMSSLLSLSTLACGVDKHDSQMNDQPVAGYLDTEHETPALEMDTIVQELRVEYQSVIEDIQNIRSQTTSLSALVNPCVDHTESLGSNVVDIDSHQPNLGQEIDAIAVNGRPYIFKDLIECNQNFSANAYQLLRTEPNIVSAPYFDFEALGSDGEVEYLVQEFNTATVITDLVTYRDYIIKDGAVNVYAVEKKLKDFELFKTTKNVSSVSRTAHIAEFSL